MGDKASPDGQQYVWKEVARLKDALSASLALGAAGNHDLDSRFKYTSHDSRGQVQALEPAFPIDDRNGWMEYWAQNYTLLTHLDVRFVLLNSAAYHGYQKEGSAPEYEQGRISERTLTRMEQDLKVAGPCVANVLICHHHPMKNDRIKTADYSQMENGDRLVNMLASSKSGPWLIIHGHKHMPRIWYAPGGNAHPTIFSAGSFSAKLPEEYGDAAKNEFYILELEVPTKAGQLSSLRGRLSTWQWSYGLGWRRPKPGMGLGPTAAFGARVDIAELATAVTGHLKKAGAGKSVPWHDIVSAEPRLAQLIPEDFDVLLEFLAEHHQVKALRDDQTNEIAEMSVNAA
jgi:hypothetical protein